MVNYASWPRHYPAAQLLQSYSYSNNHYMSNDAPSVAYGESLFEQKQSNSVAKV